MAISRCRPDPRPVLDWRVGLRGLAGFLLTGWLGGCALLAPAPERELPVVAQVDLDRYMGTWYEIGRLPHWFERGCHAAQAEYRRLDDGRVEVINRCRQGEGGPWKEARGTAWMPDAAHPARLKVRFLWPFTGDYWIIDLDPEYRLAAVGSPGRDYLWILSRDPAIGLYQLEPIVLRLKALGFNLRSMEWAPLAP